MSKQVLLKALPFLVLTALNLHCLNAHAKDVEVSGDGGVSGGGGDASEARVNEIRADILKWIGEGGHRGLNLPATLSHEAYARSMGSVLAPHAVIVGFVSTRQEDGTQDPELKVSVDGKPKTCRGFVSQRDHRMHMTCNSERFAATGAAEQYRLVHHEYAGLASVERNRGASSDYELSNQLTEFLAPETVIRLAVKKNPPTTTRPRARRGNFGEHDELTVVNQPISFQLLSLQGKPLSNLRILSLEAVYMFKCRGFLHNVSCKTIETQYQWQAGRTDAKGEVTFIYDFLQVASRGSSELRSNLFSDRDDARGVRYSIQITDEKGYRINCATLKPGSPDQIESESWLGIGGGESWATSGEKTIPIKCNVNPNSSKTKAS